jgi:hypothetical protein
MSSKEISNKQEFDYVILIPGNSFSTEFLVSMINTIHFFNINNYDYFVSVKTYPIISSLRNLLISQDLLIQKEKFAYPSLSNFVFDNKVKVNKKILMFDSDMSWTINDLRLLTENDNKITVGACKVVNGLTNLKSIDNKVMSPKDLSLLDEPFEVAAAGFAFAAIDQEVFENIKYPWFEIDEGEDFYSATGEDFSFCKKVRETLDIK